MIPSKMILVAAAAMFALTTFDAGDGARGAENRGYHAYCQWHKQQAMRSGDECLWQRWRRCVRGDLWHDDINCPDPRVMQQQHRDRRPFGQPAPYSE